MQHIYTPPHYALDNPALIRQFLQQHYFGLLLTADLQLSALPFWFDWADDTGLTGTLYAHLAAQNPQLVALQQAAHSRQPVKVVIQGPHAFVAAECYRQQPQVATWNYSLIEICGPVRLLESNATLALARKQQAQAYQALPQCVKDQLPVSANTNTNADATGNVDLPPTQPAASGRPPAGRSVQLQYEKQLGAGIVGIAVSIDKLHAKMKLSQNKTPVGRQDVLQFLQQTEQPPTVWQLMQQCGLV